MPLFLFTNIQITGLYKPHELKSFMNILGKLCVYFRSHSITILIMWNFKDKLSTLAIQGTRRSQYLAGMILNLIEMNLCHDIEIHQLKNCYAKAHPMYFKDEKVKGCKFSRGKIYWMYGEKIKFHSGMKKQLSTSYKCLYGT